MRDAGRAKVEDVLGLIPNLNWAGDTSLPRATSSCEESVNWSSTKEPNPTVGFLIDDVISAAWAGGT